MPVRTKLKPKTAPRTRRRVESSEPHSTTAKKSAKHRTNATDTIKAIAEVLDNGDVMVACQLSELVPVAQYANITLGPNLIMWKISSVDMEALVDVDWDDEDEALTPEQQAVYNRIRGALKATSVVLEHHIAEDRYSVERSIEQHNEREAAEAKKSEKKPRGKKTQQYGD